jgi:hypothetical protein
MLHDPRHERKLTLAAFALFVASKEPGERYDWRSCDECGVGQFMHAMGYDPHAARWEGEVKVMNYLAKGALDPERAEVGRVAPKDGKEWTWGALADRILRYQMRTMGTEKKDDRTLADAGYALPVS